MNEREPAVTILDFDVLQKQTVILYVSVLHGSHRWVRAIGSQQGQMVRMTNFNYCPYANIFEFGET